jgi:hypothetical protein
MHLFVIMLVKVYTHLIHRNIPRAFKKAVSGSRTPSESHCKTSSEGPCGVRFIESGERNNITGI